MYKTLLNRKSLLLAALSLAAVVPMGIIGCASDGSGGGLTISSIGDAIGGQEGALISGGGKAFAAATMDNPETENSMGESVGVTVTNQYGLADNEKLQKYVNLVGLTVVSTSSKPDGNWVFGVVNTDEINAYSGPNGYIMVTRGAIAQMKSEAELAGVIAHEIAHVTQRHGLKAVQQAGFLDAAVTAGKANEDFATFAPATDGLIDVVVKNGYSQGNEFDADKKAISLIIDAGYDPQAFVDYLKRIEPLIKSSGGFSTHPGIDDRISKLQSYVNEKGDPKGAILEDRFTKWTTK